MFGKKSQVRDTLYGAYSGGTKPGIRAVRKGDWKLVKWDVMEGTVRKTQLFNLRDNPQEFIQEHRAVHVGRKFGPLETNLAEDSKFADKRKEMEGLLKAEMVRLNDPFSLWDQ